MTWSVLGAPDASGLTRSRRASRLKTASRHRPIAIAPKGLPFGTIASGVNLRLAPCENLPAFVVAGTHSGVEKPRSLGIMARAQRGMKVQPFKIGCFIDPGLHGKVSACRPTISTAGCLSRQLQPPVLSQNLRDKDVAVVEGIRSTL